MLYIAGYTDIGSTTRGSIAIPLEPPLSEQSLDIGPNSVQSAAFMPDICIVKLISDEDCMIDVGPNADATNSARKLKADSELLVTVPMGKDFKVAVMASNSGSVSGMDSLESLLKLLASPKDAQKQFALLQDNAGKMTAAAKDLRAAGAEHKTTLSDLLSATQQADAAQLAAKTANEALAAREARLDKDAQDQADKARADDIAANARTRALETQQADVAESLAALKQKGFDLAELAGKLDARDKELFAREAIVASSQADYEAKLAKLKALTG